MSRDLFDILSFRILSVFSNHWKGLSWSQFYKIVQISLDKWFILPNFLKEEFIIIQIKLMSWNTGLPELCIRFGFSIYRDVTIKSKQYFKQQKLVSQESLIRGDGVGECMNKEFLSLPWTCLIGASSSGRARQTHPCAFEQLCSNSSIYFILEDVVSITCTWCFSFCFSAHHHHQTPQASS